MCLTSTLNFLIVQSVAQNENENGEDQTKSHGLDLIGQVNIVVFRQDQFALYRLAIDQKIPLEFVNLGKIK